jgi:hypothetical protein
MFDISDRSHLILPGLLKINDLNPADKVAKLSFAGEATSQEAQFVRQALADIPAVGFMSAEELKQVCAYRIFSAKVKSDGQQCTFQDCQDIIARQCNITEDSSSNYRSIVLSENGQQLHDYVEDAAYRPHGELLTIIDELSGPQALKDVVEKYQPRFINRHVTETERPLNSALGQGSRILQEACVTSMEVSKLEDDKGWTVDRRPTIYFANWDTNELLDLISHEILEVEIVDRLLRKMTGEEPIGASLVQLLAELHISDFLVYCRQLDLCGDHLTPAQRYKIMDGAFILGLNPRNLDTVTQCLGPDHPIAVELGVYGGILRGMVDGLALKATEAGDRELFMQIMRVATKVPSKRTEQEHQAYSQFLEQTPERALQPLSRYGAHPSRRCIFADERRIPS